MERIGYLLLEIGAVVVGVVLFTLGYTTVKNRFQGRRGRIFWTAVAVVLAFMTVTFSRAEDANKKEPQGFSDTEKKESLEDQAEWKNFLKMWNVVSQLQGETKTSEELDKIKKETEETLNALKKLTEKGLITVALVKLIEKEMMPMTNVRPIGVTCYVMIAISSQEISWKRLQDRLPLLEKISEEGRMNYWTYRNVIIKIKKDVDILEGKGNYDSTVIKDKKFHEERWEKYKEENKITVAQVEELNKKIKDSLDALLDKLTSEKLSKEDEDKIKGWMKDLGDDDWDTREKATESLKSMLDKTPAVIPYLREAAKSAEPEVKMRANQLLKSIGEEIPAELSEKEAYELVIKYLKEKKELDKYDEGFYNVIKNKDGTWDIDLCSSESAYEIKGATKTVTINPVTKEVIKVITHTGRK